jgi:hypothetical protein
MSRKAPLSPPITQRADYPTCRLLNAPLTQHVAARMLASLLAVRVSFRLEAAMRTCR